MNIDQDLIRKIAQVARIDLTQQEVQEFTPQLKEVLESFSVLDDLDLDSVEPSFQPVKLRNALRDDIIEDSLTQDDALKNAKHVKDGYFKGPKSI